MSNSPYGPKDVRRVSFKRLPKAVRDAGISMIELKLATGTVTDLVTISDTDWHQACRRFNAIQRLAGHPGRLGRRVKEIAKMFSDPLWMAQLDWPTIIHDLGLGHPLKFAWEERVPSI